MTTNREDRGSLGSSGYNAFSAGRDWQYALVLQEQETFLKHV